MAVHLPLGPELFLKHKLLMLASHNLEPANGANYCTFSGHGLGLYYMTRAFVNSKKNLGQDLTFYS
jgi:hypothetical protein